MTRHEKQMLINSALTVILTFAVAFVLGVSVLFQKGAFQ